MKLCGEAASTDIAAAAAFPKEFQRYIEQSNYFPDLIFNVDETGLYRKMLPTRTIISPDERSVP